MLPSIEGAAATALPRDVDHAGCKMDTVSLAMGDASKLALECLESRRYIVQFSAYNGRPTAIAAQAVVSARNRFFMYLLLAQVLCDLSPAGGEHAPRHTQGSACRTGFHVFTRIYARFEMRRLSSRIIAVSGGFSSRLTFAARRAYRPCRPSSRTLRAAPR